MNEFKGVPSSKIKEQIRMIDFDIRGTEQEMWITDIDTGEDYIDNAADYMLSDLYQRKLTLKRELAKRWCKPSEQGK